MIRDAFGRPIRTRDQVAAAAGFPRKGDCPDCDADSRLVETAPGVYLLEIHHDDTCPAHGKHT
ncbi:hypothetical protein [Microbacterium indicum]|uniref:hypothetical protein n=1 Tax=Microbacterium indicum TaxID=358100 RepID=UPI000405DA85|nr:hypothetical protein [Microbacterium indicum]